MKNRSLSFLITVIGASLLASCGQQASNSETTAAADSKTSTSVVAAELASGNELVDINDAKRKMMKTADLRMRVENVQRSTVQLERITNQLGGLVMRSQLDNNIRYSKTLPYNSDSLRLANAYQTTSYLQVKVPALHLDSFLSIVADQSAFIYNRNLLLEDATLQYISNDLKQKSGVADVAVNNANRLSRRTADAIDAADYASAVDNNKIEKRIDNLSIQDNVKYATVSLAIEQPEKVDYVIVADVDKQMQAGFGTQATNALASGWSVFKIFLIGLVHIWPLWMLLGLAFVVYKYWKKRFPKLRSSI